MKQSIKNIALHISIAAFLVSPLSAAPQQSPSEAGAPRIPVPVCNATTEYELAEYRYTGRVVPISSVDITSRISADLTKIGFKDGDFVKKGQLLYVFDDTRYDATMKMDQAKIAEYEAKLIYAKNDYERIDQLYKKGVSTKDEMESALSQYKSYQASLLGAKAEFILSEDDYNHCRIYSPISGVIGLTNYTEGNYITPSSGILVTIIQLDPIRVKFSMSTRDFLNNFSDIEGLKKNCTVKIKMADNSFFDEEGSIEFVNNEAVKTTDTIQVFAKFKNSKSRLLPNNTVAVYLGNKKGVEKVVIPSTALMYDEDSPYVFVLDDNNVPKRRNVSLGRMDGGRQFVNSGLKAGERVVSDGVHKVIENVKVDIVK